jgi:phosphoribosylanthranilate isomerase
MLEKDVVQIAGVIDLDEARMLARCGVRYLGFPLRLPVHRPDLTEREAAHIIERLEPPVQAVLITYLSDAGTIAAFCMELGVRIVQLHGDIGRDQLETLRALDPGLAVIKSLVVGSRDERALEAMLTDLSPSVDAYLIDTFDPKTGVSGATGRTHDWSVSRRLVELSDRPVILGGGLTPDNVRQAILEVRPGGVDAHTGLEDAGGRKSREKVEAFVREARDAFRACRA